MTEQNTKTDTETDDLPRVVLRRSWTVHTFFKDNEDDYRVDEEEFLTEFMAHQYAREQAAQHGVGITFGDVCD
jgi:hypothetical protein